jgi:surfactin synthase thioesterase subunit
MSASPWFIDAPTGPSRLRLYCFPYAGGSASAWLPWRATLDASIGLSALQLPGRGARLAEPPLRSWAELVPLLAQQVAARAHEPFAFFGHSLGALLAFEVARYATLRHWPTPVQLIVSGAAAPRRREAGEALDEHDDERALARLAGLNGTPPDVLAHRELMALLLPAIRADFALSASYRYRPGLRLQMPLSVWAGDADADTGPGSPPELLDDWQHETTGPCTVRSFEGDHFFIHASQAQVVSALNAQLLPAVPAR